MHALTNVVALCIRVLSFLLCGDGTCEGQRANHGRRSDEWLTCRDRAGDAVAMWLGRCFLKRQLVRVPVRPRGNRAAGAAAVANGRLPNPNRR